MDSAAASRFDEEIERRIDSELSRRVAQAQRMRHADAHPEALLWAALAPGWTVALAEACRFPTVPGGPADFFDRLAKRGLCEVRQAPSQQGDESPPAPFYVMSPAGRAEVLGTELAGDPPRDDGGPRSGPAPADGLARSMFEHGRWRHVVSGIAIRMLSVSELPPALQRWASLAAHAANPEQLERALDDGVKRAFDAGDSGEILRLIEAMRPLASFAARDGDPRSELTLQRAGRRLELLHRRTMDEEHLRLFLRRADQIDAFTKLMAAKPGDPWALHFIGAGGVGKTMLLRYITVQLLTDRGQRSDFADLDVAFSRVDFDYLNADFPSLAPGLLLWAFAQELRHYDRDGSATEWFDKAELLFQELHRQLRRVPGATSSPVQSRMFFDAVSIYADALHRLDRQILLIIDTCEELAKSRAGGSPLPNVDETFHILESLHDRVPGLRVVFCGRRPLAAAGAGWQCPGVFGLSPRPYLRLHQLRGFDHDEAREYLVQGEAPENLIDAVIAGSSPDAGSAVTVQWNDPGLQPIPIPRCNPYELRLNLKWAKEVPPPRPEDIASATSEQYVELRILRRLHDDSLERLLPAVALLGHFDRELLQVCSNVNAGEFASAFERLQEQEWIDRHYRGGPSGGELVLDVEAGVRRRLRKYYSRPGGMDASIARRAASHLAHVTLRPERDLMTLEWTQLDAAVNAWAHDPDAGAAWWKAVEERFFAERAPDWIMEVTGPLLDVNGSAAAPDPSEGAAVLPVNPLRPFILATHAAALVHTARITPALGEWEEVYATTAFDQRPRWRELHLRALIGRIVVQRQFGRGINLDVARELRTAMQSMDSVEQPEFLASLVAGLEALIEEAEVLAGRGKSFEALIGPAPGGGTPSAVEHLARLARDGWRRWRHNAANAAGPVAFALSLAGRALVLFLNQTSDPAWADEAAARALALLRESLATGTGITGGGAVGGWMDWIAPEDLHVRLRLEFARAAYPALLPPRAVLEALGAAPMLDAEASVPAPAWLPSGSSIDVDRLRSAMLSTALAVSPVAMPRLAAFGYWQEGWKTPIARNNWAEFPDARFQAHRRIAPLVVTAAAAWAAAGHVDAAIEQLFLVYDHARQTDPEAWSAAQEALIALARRFRLEAHAERLEDRGLPESTREEIRNAWALRVLAIGEQAIPDGVQPRSDLAHAIWSTLYALDEQAKTEALRRGRVLLGVDGESAAREPVSSRADESGTSLYRVELALLAGASPRSVVLPDPVRFGSGARAERNVGAALRQHALLGVPLDLGWQERLGQRRIAESALAEGELLALRLPGPATKLLRIADAAFAESGDPVGALLAFTLVAMYAPADPGSRAELLAGLGNRYAKLPAELGLPPWTALEKVGVAAGGWLPWIQRIVGCQAALSDPKATRGIDLWLAAHRQPGATPVSGVVVDIPPRVPAEWRRPLRDRGLGAVAPTASWRVARKVWGSGLQLLGGALGISGWVVLFQGFVWGVNALFPGFERVALGWRLLTFLAVPVSIGATFGAFESVRKGVPALLAALGRLDAAVVALPAGLRRGEKESARFRSGVPVELNVDWHSALLWRRADIRRSVHPRFPLWPTGLARAAPGESTGAFNVQGQDPYSILAARLPAPVRTLLAKRAQATRSLGMDVRLWVASGMHDICWEAAIGLSTIEPGAPALRATAHRFRREAAGRAPAPLRSGDRYRVAVMARRDAMLEIARQGWATRVSGLTLSAEPPFAVDASRAGASSPRLIVHAIGQIEQTSAGLRLRVAPPLEQRSSTVTAPAYREWSAEEIVRGEPVAVLLQVEPAPDILMRAATDRYNAGLFRAFAAELSALGVRYVITLPRMKPAGATEALRTVASALLRRLDAAAVIGAVLWPSFWSWSSWHAARLDAAVARVRQAVLAESERPEDGFEAAFDVSFYAHSPDPGGARQLVTRDPHLV